MSRLACALVVVSCAGPEAPDVEVCRDIITRLCLGPVCDSAVAVLTVTEMGCVDELTARTGCGRDGFAFTAFTRQRALVCREPLVRASTSRLVKAPCPEVAEALSLCPDLVSFLKEGQ